jgi:hypothetical protein
LLFISEKSLLHAKFVPIIFQNIIIESIIIYGFIRQKINLEIERVGHLPFINEYIHTYIHTYIYIYIYNLIFLKKNIFI